MQMLWVFSLATEPRLGLYWMRLPGLQFVILGLKYFNRISLRIRYLIV